MIKRGASLLASLASILIAASPVWAQSAQQADDAELDGEDIVVTGTLPTQSAVSRQARAITDMSSAIRHEPLPRFEARLCPGVIGMVPEYASLIVDRVRYNAEQLDLWLAEDDGTCTPNFIVAFVEDGQAHLQNIADNQHWLFRDMSPSQRSRLLNDDGPARVWTITETRTRDGMPVPRSESLHEPPVVNTWMAHSKIYTATREDIASVIVLLDKDSVKGKTLVQLADYATMRGLARTKPADGDGQKLDTILALFDPAGSPPPRLTDFDQAYLASLYDGMPNLPGITKVLGVNRQLRLQARDAERASAGELRE